MTDTPTIRFSGQGSRREAAQLGQSIGSGVLGAAASHPKPFHIDTLRVQVPAGSSNADVERAIRRAIERMMQGGRP